LFDATAVVVDGVAAVTVTAGDPLLRFVSVPPLCFDWVVNG